MSTEPETNNGETGAATEITEATASESNAFTPYLMLAVEEIRLPEISNVRPYSSKQDSEREIAEIQRLMLSIEQEGQIQPVVVMPIKGAKDGEPGWDLIAGRRRLRAIGMHNLSSDEPILVKAIIGDETKNVGQLFRRAAHENIMRENITAIDFAYNIKTVRANKKWDKAKDTKKVADFFGCSEAQITQHEKLMELDEEFQQAVGEGKLTREGAYALLKVKAVRRKEVYDAALKKQKVELGEGAILSGILDSTPEDKPAKKSKVSGASKAGGVKAKHVKSAAREADPESKQSRSMKDWVEYLEACQGPVYGYPNGAVWLFVDNFKKWRKGEIQDRTLDKYWNNMVESAPRGTSDSATGKSAAKPKK